MSPDFQYDLQARQPKRARLGQAVEQCLADGGSIATLPYHATAKLTHPRRI